MNNELNKTRKHILDGFLNNLEGIASKEYQQRVWIKGLGPECDDFVEAVCDFFDLGEYIFADPQGYGLSDKQLRLLIDFRDRFKVFADNNNFPEKFIDTPEWKKITEMAKDVLRAFNYHDIA